VNGYVNCIAVEDTTVYLGGYFTQIGGEEREAFGAASAVSGAALAMTANVDQQVKEIVVRNGVVYVGGAFRSIGGVPRFCLAALEPGSGRVLDWNPDPDAVVWAMTADDHQVYPVGAFTRMGATPSGLMAAVSQLLIDSGPSPSGRSPSLAFVGVTNPCKGSGVVHFTLLKSATVSLHVYDLQGRRMKTLLRHSLQAPGEHEIPVDTSDLSPGHYCYRLETESESATRKMVILP
jgi:hypothetical protein